MPGLLRPCRYLLLMLLCSLCNAEPLVVFGDNDYPPVIYTDPAGQPRGVLADILDYVSKASGTPIDLRLYPWKRAYTSATKARGGVIGLSKTPERMQLFDFSAPIYDDNIHVVVLRGTQRSFHSLQDLQGLKIGVQSGASYGEEVDRAIADGRLTTEADQSQVSRLKKLLRGRIDAAFIGNGDLGLERLLASDPELTQAKQRFLRLEPALNHDLLYLAFAKSLRQQEFLHLFNKLLNKARAQKAIPGLQGTMPLAERP